MIDRDGLGHNRRHDGPYSTFLLSLSPTSLVLVVLHLDVPSFDVAMAGADEVMAATVLIMECISHGGGHSLSEQGEVRQGLLVAFVDLLTLGALLAAQAGASRCCTPVSLTAPRLGLVTLAVNCLPVSGPQPGMLVVGSSSSWRWRRLGRGWW